MTAREPDALSEPLLSLRSHSQSARPSFILRILDLDQQCDPPEEDRACVDAGKRPSVIPALGRQRLCPQRRPDLRPLSIPRGGLVFRCWNRNPVPFPELKMFTTAPMPIAPNLNEPEPFFDEPIGTTERKKPASWPSR
jgi:hypothetical protein